MKSRLIAAALCTGTGAGMVNENLPHGTGAECKEVGAILPAGLARVHQTQVGLVDQSSGLQGVIRALPCHQTPGNLTKLAIDQRSQAVKGFLITATPGPEQDRDLVG